MRVANTGIRNLIMRNSIVLAVLLPICQALLCQGLHQTASCAEPPLSDVRANERVRRAIKSDYRLRRFDLTVSTVMGHMELSGTVPTLSDRHSAEQLVQKILGDRTVRNAILVDPNRFKLLRDQHIANLDCNHRSQRTNQEFHQRTPKLSARSRQN